MTPARREPVSIVCVFNDAQVRASCLDRSIDELRHEAPRTEYLPIDNVDHQFATAGAALNHGARTATNPFVVFVHQDVYLHSLVALEIAAGQLADDSSIGVLGAIGMSTRGRPLGQIRDRVVLLGERVGRPTDVDSLDEVLFMASARRLAAETIVESPDLAWHAYAVEYGVRAREQGLRVVAGDIPLTHNSLTINLARLSEAHAEIARRHPAAVPIRTTCGTVTSAAAGRPCGPVAGVPAESFLGRHRWRLRWLWESVHANAARLVSSGGTVVLGDIRRDIDDVLQALDDPLRVVNVGGGALPMASRFDVDLMRGPNRVQFRREGATSGPARERGADAQLITNLTVAGVRAASRQLAAGQRVIGYHGGLGFWMLQVPDGVELPRGWRRRQAVPFGSRLR